MFTHHRLKVYEKALAVAASAEALCAPWGKQHAIVDQFCRASESIGLNIAEGARLAPGPSKVRTLDYALGSTLECAACLDIARIKQRLSSEEALHQKERFLEITRMLIGLRKAWGQMGLQEEAQPYPAHASSSESKVLFHHESLDVYQIGLEFMGWFVSLPGGCELSDRLCREVDKAATSVVLNVAEGNGRYGELDHRRILEIAAASAVKAAVYFDLYQQKILLGQIETSFGQELLGRILARLSRL
jgi:four helix bundle protein